MAIPINLVFEDELSEYVLTQLLSRFGSKFYSCVSYNGHGFGYIKTKINGFNEACKAIPFIVLTDLDNTPCPPELIENWFEHPLHPNMIFRIAVREVEAWLLADIEGYAKFLGISEANFSHKPEQDPDPKRTLIALTKRSRRRSIKEDIIPINGNATIGPNYNGRLMEFVFEFWDIDRAMGRSESLRRACEKLDEFQMSLPG